MAEEVEMTPVEMTPVAAEPPKANPLSKPTVPGGTVKLAPIAHKPVPGAPGAALKPGLKLPPKPGATVSALKPGVKLPPKPGATASALKPGLKLPPKPVIRKPGATVTAVALPKPVAPLPPREGAAAPAAPAAPAEKPMETLKTVTQKLKGVTQPIPQQAILRKTGIIADGAVTEAQKEAAKHKTARISLSDAMGVAPVKDEHAPMKTIRIKRPVNIPGSTASLTPQPKPPAPADEDAPTMATVAPDDAAANADGESSVTQRKTLKIARPGGAVRPAGKFGIRRPGAPAAPAAASAAPAAYGAAPAPAADAGVADIADIPSAIPPIPAPSAPVDATPGWLVALSTLVQAAAVIMIGALAFFLYENSTTLYF